MTQEIGYTENKIKEREPEDKISIIDVSCGAGTFLYSAVDRLIDSFDDGTKEQAKYIAGLIDKNIFGSGYSRISFVFSRDEYLDENASFNCQR